MKNLILPLGRRAGTFVAGWIVATLAVTDAATADAIYAACAAAVLVSVDLINSWLERR